MLKFVNPQEHFAFPVQLCHMLINWRAILMRRRLSGILAIISMNKSERKTITLYQRHIKAYKCNVDDVYIQTTNESREISSKQQWTGHNKARNRKLTKQSLMSTIVTLTIVELIIIACLDLRRPSAEMEHQNFKSTK